MAIGTPDWVLEAIAVVEGPVLRHHGRSLLVDTSQPLGHGSFGFVFATFNPDWVFKLSIEGSEAFYAEASRSLLKGPAAGICEYLDPIKINVRGVPLWAMWKRRVQLPTFAQWFAKARTPPRELRDYWDHMLWEGTRDEAKAARALQRQWEAEQGLDAGVMLEELQQCGIAVALTLDFTHIGRVERTLRTRLAKARGMLFPTGSFQGWRYTKEQVDDPKLRAAIRLLGYEWWLGNMQGHMLVGDLARTLLRFYNEGIVIADVQHDNVGLHRGVWTLFDAGFTVPIDRRWAPLWNKDGDRTATWDWEGRDAAWTRLQGGPWWP